MYKWAKEKISQFSPNITIGLGLNPDPCSSSSCVKSEKPKLRPWRSRLVTTSWFCLLCFMRTEMAKMAVWESTTSVKALNPYTLYIVQFKPPKQQKVWWPMCLSLYAYIYCNKCVENIVTLFGPQTCGLHWLGRRSVVFTAKTLNYVKLKKGYMGCSPSCSFPRWVGFHPVLSPEGTNKEKWGAVRRFPTAPFWKHLIL